MLFGRHTHIQIFTVVATHKPFFLWLFCSFSANIHFRSQSLPKWFPNFKYPYLFCYRTHWIKVFPNKSSAVRIWILVQVQKKYHKVYWVTKNSCLSKPYWDRRNCRFPFLDWKSFHSPRDSKRYWNQKQRMIFKIRPRGIRSH